jgi:hypothetical protein
VVKEVIPPQLAPSGVLGLIGITEKIPTGAKTVRVSSWSRFIEELGPGSAFCMPEARQALQNGVFELVVCPLAAGKGTPASVEIPGGQSGTSFKLQARAAGTWANTLAVKVTTRQTVEEKDVFDLEVQRPGTQDFEIYRNLTMEDADSKEDKILKGNSDIVKVSEPKKDVQPKAGSYILNGGGDASPEDYANALAALVDEPDVDMVAASIQDFGGKAANAIKIYSNIISHCEEMSDECKGRMGFGQVAHSMTPDNAVEMVSNIVSDRFVLLAPHGVVGAVAGRIGSMTYFQSPTFKTISGMGDFDPALGVEAQRKLLKSNVVPVIKERGRGIIILRGLTTDGDQISVRRVADRAVRGVKMIGDLFIGRLNNEDGRGALKQKLVEFLTQMEKDGAIVPKTDGSDPAFKVDVYSSQADFAQGIVRVNIAVRPVRAIDYIYATILVQV